MKKHLFLLLSAFNVYALSDLKCPLNEADKKRAQDFLEQHPDARLCLEKDEAKECFSLAFIQKMIRASEDAQPVVAKETKSVVAEEAKAPEQTEEKAPAVETTAPATKAALPTDEQK